ncbi:MAG TPA: hypothetical protein VEJ23_00980 [Solirubrobacteraceae bacterium]|nr:hypothetical protein [Solirubrobacteraceae bacterium]
MLAIGIVVGAAIGPSPSSSLAGTSDLALVLRALSALEAARHAAPTPAPAQPATHTPAASTAGAAPASSSTSSTAASSATPAPATQTSPPSSSTKPASPAPTNTGGAGGGKLPPVTNVWLIELSGEGFSQAIAGPATAPYLTGQAIPSGTLLSSWSTLDAGAFASDAALLAGSPPQTLDTIVQPPCPEGAAGAACAPGTPGALSAADGFLKQVLPTITATAAYRAHGLIVVTFSSVQTATATGLPAGAATATLSSQPPAGVLLISPFAAAGAHPSTAFNPTSPGKSVKALLHA